MTTPNSNLNLNSSEQGPSQDQKPPQRQKITHFNDLTLTLTRHDTPYGWSFYSAPSDELNELLGYNY